MSFEFSDFTLTIEGRVIYCNKKKEKSNMFDLGTMEVGDVWKDGDNDLINVLVVKDGRYVGWYEAKSGISVLGAGVQFGCESMTLVSRGGVDYRELEHGECYHCYIKGDHKTVIRRYSANENKMVDFRGNKCSLSTYAWISEKIEMSNDQHEQCKKGARDYV